jgi:predicted nicotinamide N-methyase
MSIDKSIQRLKAELAGRYRLDEERHNLCGRPIGVTCVEDAEELFSRLIVADPNSIEVLDERLPYWATLWQSAIALAEHLVSSDHLSPGEPVLELGCGLGLASAIACLKRARVTATDYQPDALKFTRLNCLQIAGSEPEVFLLDWRDPPQDKKYPTLLGADLVYEARFFDPLIACFDTLLEPDGHVFFSEPNREMGRPFFDRLDFACWDYTPLLEQDGATVYEIRRME